MRSSEVVRQLITAGRMRARDSRLYDEAIEPAGPVDLDRIEGMLLGLAIGDALGATSESLRPEERRERFGEIRDYQVNPRTGDARGYPTDDTQLAFWTLECLVGDRRFVPEHVSNWFTRGRIFGVGRSVRAFLRNKQDGGSWDSAGVESAGNGALMRIAPMIIPALSGADCDPWAEAALSAMITHNDSAAISSAVSFARILSLLIRISSAPDQHWWLEEYVETARRIEIGKEYSPRGGVYRSFSALLSDYTLITIKDALSKGHSTLEVCNNWWSGAYLLETVPCVIYILMKHAGNPEEAIIRAVNDTKDNDTVAAIVGAAVGALHGKSALPDRWIRGLSGRTGMDDGERIFELIETMKDVFFSNDDIN